MLVLRWWKSHESKLRGNFVALGEQSQCLELTEKKEFTETNTDTELTMEIEELRIRIK